MKQSTGRGRSAWFWVGVALLAVSALWWLILVLATVDQSGDIGDAIIFGVITTAIPIGIGIYGIRRGRKPRVAEEMASEQILAGEDAQTLVRQKEISIAKHKVSLFNKLCWLIIISVPILTIIIVVVFDVLDLPVWSMLLTLFATWAIDFYLFNLASKYQARYHKSAEYGTSSSVNQGIESGNKSHGLHSDRSPEPPPAPK